MRTARLTTFASLRGALLFTVLASIAGGQNQTWIRQFGTATLEWGGAAAPDGSGGVYVSGSTLGSLGGPSAGPFDAWVARYDGTGNQTWIRQLGTNRTDNVWAAAPDGSGGVYIGGYTGGSFGGPNAGGHDAWIAHYDGTGNQSWIRQLGSNDSDFATAAAPDGSGGVYVSGSTDGSLGGPNAGGYDAWIARYDGTGNQSWIRQLGSSDDDFPNAAARDGVGGVYVGGSTGGDLSGPNAGGMDVWLARYDGAGNQTWIRQFGTPGSEWAVAAATDGLGGVYVSGYTNGSPGGPSAGGTDAWLAHYDGTGNQTWIRQLGTSSPDRTVAAAPDGAGGVYVSGATDGSLGGPNAGVTDAWLAHYDGTGNQSWIRQLGTSGYEYLRAAAPDGAGGVFVSGDTSGSLGGPNAGGHDAWIAHYDGLRVTAYCNPAIANSTGQPGVLTAIGSNTVAANNLTVIADQLPANAFGFFLTSRDQGSTFPVNNSQGRLCLGGFIGRYVGPGQIKNSGSTGSFMLALDLTTMAHPQNPVSAQPGETWNFQAWYRDANPSGTSNFTDAVSVTLQ